jgi:death-on-curing protein
MQYLTVQEIVIFNKEIVGDALSAVRDQTVLESAVARPQASAFGQDAYPTICEKAAALLHSLILNHPFVDGNKRTGLASATIFLNRNGLTESFDIDEAFEFIIGIVEGKHDVPAIAAWLEGNTA